MTRPRMCNQAGFTLVELLVAITVLGLLTGLLTTGVRAIVRSFHAVHEEVVAATAVEQAERVITRYLGQARPALVWRNDPPAAELDFTGGEGSLQFRAFLPPEIGGWDARFKLALEEHEPGDRLVLEVEGVDGPPEFERFLLLPNVGKLEIAYWGILPEDETATWHGSWQESLELPKLVRISIQQDNRTLPPIVATLPIAPR